MMRGAAQDPAAAPGRTRFAVKMGCPFIYRLCGGHAAPTALNLYHM